MSAKTVNLRDMPEGLVRQAKAYAALQGVSLKAFVIQALEAALADPSKVTVVAVRKGKKEKKRKKGK